jgi:hypothetical protein
MKRFVLTVTTTEPLLGGVPKSKDIYRKWILSQKPELTAEQVEEELASLLESEEKGWTGFHQVDGEPILYDYVIKGFCKSACYFCRQMRGAESKKLLAFKKKIDGLVMVYPRRIPVIPGGELFYMERALRAETRQGPRVCLARSDAYPAGTTLTCELHVLAAITEGMLREWFDYGQYMGLGQWRSGGYGRFEYELEAVE